MPIGALNPGDLSRSTATRPATVLNAINQRRWHTDALHTIVQGQDLNGVLGQLRYCYDHYGIADVEGDDTLLQKAIQAGALSLTGNIALLQAQVGAADKVAYWTGASSMATFTATGYSRGLLSKTSLAQWQEALGIEAAGSANVVALSNLAGGADQLGYFNGVGTMAQTPFTPLARNLLDDLDQTSMRGTIGLGSMATESVGSYVPKAGGTYTGAVFGLTAAPGAPGSTQLATTAYVMTAVAGGAAAYQPLHVNLTALSGVGAAADRLPYFTSGSAAGVTVFTPYARTLLDDIDAPAARSTLLLGTMAVANTADYIPKTGGTFTGVVSGLTASPGGVGSTQFATTAYVMAAINTGGGAYQPLAAPLTTLSSSTAAFLALSDDATPAAMRTTLELVAVASSGSAADLTTGTLPTARLPVPLQGLAPLATLNNKMFYWTTSSGSAAATFDTTTFGRGLLNLVNSAALLSSAGGAAAVHTHVIADTTGLQTALDGKQPLHANLTALAGLASNSNLLPYFNGVGTMALAVFSALGRQLIAATSDTAAQDVLGLGSAATYDVGISGNAVPLLDAATNTFSGTLMSTSNLRVDTSIAGGQAQLFLITPVGQSATVRMRTGADVRWVVGKEGASTENYVINAYDDAGALHTALEISRTTRIAAFLMSPTAPTPAVGDNTTKLATTAYVRSEFADFLATTTTFTRPVYITTDVDPQFIITSSEDTAKSAPVINLRRFSPTPAADDVLGQLLFVGYSAALASTTYAIIDAQISDATGALDGRLRFRSLVAGVLQEVLTVRAGVCVGSAVSKGLDTLNAPIIYENGTLLANKYAPIDAPIFTGTVTAEAIVVNAGPVTVNRTGDAADAIMDIKADAGKASQLILKTTSNSRWSLNKNDDPESGANAGSNLTLWAHTDAGGALGMVLSVARSTRLLTFNLTPLCPTPAAGTNTTAMATTAYVQGEFAAHLARQNTFTAQTTITTTGGQPSLILTNPATGGNDAPILDLRRENPTPLANESMGNIRFQGRSSTAVLRTYADIFVYNLNPSNTAEVGQLRFRTMTAGNLNLVLTLGSGAQIGAPTGGDKGPGTLNAKEVYNDDVALTCLPLQSEFLESKHIDLAKWDGLAVDGHHKTAHAFAQMVEAGFDPRDPEQYIRKALADQALPGMPTLDTWEHNSLSSGEMFTKLWLAVEMLALAWMKSHESRTVH